jgi:hypothetical protein
MRMFKHLKMLPWLFFFATISVARADGGKTVTVTNNTSFTMTEFYASPSVDSSWENTSNLLAGQAIAPGQSTTITIADGIDHCHYDLMGVLYGSAEHAYQYSVNACRGESWAVHY